MKITMHSSKVVKPAYAADGSSSPFAQADFVPLSVFDKVTFDQHIPAMYSFPGPSPPAAVLEAGLARALAEYHEWAGRRGVDAGGEPVILLTDAGVRLVEATADAALAALPRDPTPPETLRCLQPSISDGAEELMLVQVTRFACGAFVVCCSFLHLVGDGHAVFRFVAAWGQSVRGVPIDPVPVHDRVSLFVPRDPPQVAFRHRGVEFKTRCTGNAPCTTTTTRNGGYLEPDEVVVSMVHFTREWISKLKSQASSSSTTRISTLQCVLAHLWRCITKARGLNGDETTRLRIAVDGRTRMRVPNEYTGNVVLWARPATSVRDLMARPLGRTVDLISREVAKMDERYFRSFIDFAAGSGEEERTMGLVPTADAAETVLSPDVEVDSVLGLPFDRADFGTGKPLFFMPGYMPLEGVVFVVPCFSGDGSVYAYVPLFSRAVDAFKKCCYSLAGADARI